MVMDITRGLLLLVIMVMDMVESVTITEVPRESKDMVMDITRGLLLLVIMVMDMDLLMYMLNRRTMDMVILSLMSMDTIFTRGLLMLDMAMVVIATNMLTDHTLITRSKFTTQKPTTTDITRGQLLLVIMVMDMDLPMSMLNRRTMDMDILSPMSMDTISIKDQLMLDMAMVVIATNMLTDHTLITRSKSTTQKPTTTDITRGLLLLVIIVMDMDLPMSMLNRRTMDMDIQSLMSMDTISIKDQLMHPMKATNMFLILHTPTMKWRCTTLTKCQIEIVPQLFSSAMSIIPRNKKYTF